MLLFNCFSVPWFIKFIQGISTYNLPKEVNYLVQGTVKFFHDQKNYGFIEVEDEEDDIFFHVSNLDGDAIEEGAEVEFETEDGDKGPEAVDVKEL